MRLRPWFYNTLYRFNVAPWDKEVRPQLTELVESGRLTPAEYPAALDLGCGTGAEAVYLARQGFGPVLGVDFSPVAVRRARARASAAGVADRCTFTEADITAGPIPGTRDQYDLICDFGALNDTEGEQRLAVARAIHRLTRPGSAVLVWCFQGDKEQLKGGAKMAPMLAPAEEKELFADAFELEYLPTRPRTLMLLMTRR
ncbi:Methyltransferase domain-containing protein [Micromonospora nigra]|uniref:Methyltransferase domain-containing protein n=1 Tax=Micromonospora nigra TaxID=145857 RepID=A0A1C6RC14_9ACTN|nr:class I SAM-dependent methyltransferase [Micromonospora nigra]SCL14692.1 Methyltransferase domain-containing protein [Micromonospora nigra]